MSGSGAGFAVGVKIIVGLGLLVVAHQVIIKRSQNSECQSRYLHI